MNEHRSCEWEAILFMIYFSEQKISCSPSEHSFLKVPFSVDSVISFSCEIFIDELSSVAVDVVELI